MLKSPTNAEITEAPEPATPGQDAVGFVLAGGRSSRMGRDKALVEFDGLPLIAHALGILHAAGLEASIAGARTALDHFAPVVPDLFPDHGPLGGICSALASTSVRRAVFLPVDLPLLPPELIRWILDHAQKTDAAVTVASLGGFAQTFPAVIDQACLPALQQELAAARLRCLTGFQTAAVSLGKPLAILPVEAALARGDVVFEDSSGPERWFLNLNRPQDLPSAPSPGQPDRVS